MNPQEIVRGMRHQNQLARERYRENLRAAQEEALKGQWGAQSSGGEVLVVMGGDIRIKDLAIHPEVWGDMNEDDLADAIVDAYKDARRNVHAHQQRIVLERIGLWERQRT